VGLVVLERELEARARHETSSAHSLRRLDRLAELRVERHGLMLAAGGVTHPRRSPAEELEGISRVRLPRPAEARAADGAAGPNVECH
jgi:hypothetical protein